MTGISLETQVLLLLNAALWAIYAIGTGSYWVGAPGIISAPLAISVIVIIVRSRRTAQQRRSSVLTSDCKFCTSGQTHRVFITNKAGWGSIVNCSSATRAHGHRVFTDSDVAELRKYPPTPPQ